MTKGQRRLLVVTDCAHGGTFEVAKMLAEGLCTDFAVSLAAPGEAFTDALISRLGALAVGAHAIGTSYENLWRSTYDQVDAMELLDAAPADLIVSVDGAELSSLLALKTVAWRRRIPYVVVVNLLSDDVLVRFAPFLTQSKEALHRAQAVVFVSEASRQRFEALLPDSAGTHLVVPNACRDVFFEPPNEAVRTSLRADLGVADDQLLCFTAARIETRKGQALGVAAFAKLAAIGEVANFRWMIAGRVEPWDRNQFTEVVAAADLSDLVTILGERRDIPDLMDASDLFILTSYAEGMPLCVIEALAKGVPVIATGVDGIIEQLDPTCGILLPSPAGNEAACIDALAGALDAMVKDPGRLARMRVAAHERARSMFHRDICVERYRTILSQYEDARNAMEPQAASEPDFSLRVGSTLDFADAAQIWNHLDDGWAQCETHGIWTDGTSSTLRLRFDDASSRLVLRFDVTPYGRRKDRRTRIYANGIRIANWRPGRLRTGRQTMSIILDVRRTGRAVSLRLENPGATRPCDIGAGSDWRQLALFVHRLDVEEAQATWRETPSRLWRSNFGKASVEHA